MRTTTLFKSGGWMLVLALVLNDPGQLAAQPPADSARDAFPALIWVKGGRFQMGCTSEQQNCTGHERPVHTVEVGDFFMGATEVTVAQFSAFVQATGYRTDAERGTGSFIRRGTELVYRQGVHWRMDERGQERAAEEGNFPVLHLSWEDACAYTAWLTEKTGWVYRLPTEAEWEYAARGGILSKGNLYAGSQEADSVAWHWDNAGGLVHPVQTKLPNELGLYDMSGNVQEWCLDEYGSYHEAGRVQELGPERSPSRVLRGGAWNREATRSRVSSRIHAPPTSRSNNRGFRVVRLGAVSSR